MKWIHFSDFHIGKDPFAESKAIERSLLLVENRLAEGWVPNAIFVTGDISQSGKSSQFEKFHKEFHKPLLEMMQGSKVKGWQEKVFYIPGNHDVDRLADRYPRDLILTTATGLRPTAESSKERKNCLVRFAAFEKFVSLTDVQGESWLGSNSASYVDHITVEGCKYAVVSLNTAWLCQDDSDRGTLLIGMDILEHALSLAEPDSIKIILGHHPISHLEDTEQGRVSRLLSKNNAIYLHGHRHKNTGSQTVSDGSMALHLQSGAAFQAHDNDHYANGILFGEIDAKRQLAVLQAKEWADEWVDSPKWFPASAKDDSRPDTYSFKIHIPERQSYPTTEMKAFDQLKDVFPKSFLDKSKDSEDVIKTTAVEPASGLTYYPDLLESCYSENVVALERLKSKGAIADRQNWVLTDLQKKFQESISQIVSPFQDIILAGGTSSGKTTLAETMFGLAKPYGIETARVIYVAPTRALAQERYRAWRDVYSDISTNTKEQKSVILSTGEDHTDDGALSRGDFLVACLVYEKANVLLSMAPDYLRKINLVIIDELHMIDDLHRGCVLESLIAKIKFEKERRSSSLDSSNPLRIVGITTDSLGGEALNEMFSHFDSTTLETIPPLIATSSVRPKPVDFSFLSVGSQDTATYTKTLFRSFANDEPIVLDAEQSKVAIARVSSAEAAISVPNNQNRTENDKDEYLKVIREFVEDWMYSNPTGRRLLVFSHTKDIGLEIAKYVRGAIGRSSTLMSYDPESHELSKLVEVVDKQEMSISSEEMKAALERGVLMHNASVSPRLRHAIEDYVSRPLQQEARSEIIIATETLSYGVNLQVEDVLFGSLHFPSSERRPSEGRGSKRLSKNAFFNMAGRAGRLNQTAPRATVTIFISKKQGDSGARVIKEYFDGKAEISSTLFHGKDVNATKEVQNGDVSIDVAPGTITYPFVRTVLDGMRFLGGMPGRNGVQRQSGATPTELTNKYLKRTLFWHQKHKNTALLDLMSKATEFTIEGCMSEDLKLLESFLGRPRLTKLGASVIDTGTEIETVLPLRRSLRALFDAWTVLSEEPMPFVLALLPIISQEEIHRRVIENCPEVKFVGTWSPERNLTDLVERISVSLTKEVNLPGICPEMFVAVIREYRNWGVTNQPLNHLQAKYAEGIHDACLRIYLGLLNWIQGSSVSSTLEVMQTVYDPHAIKTARLSLDVMSFADGLTWKILFASELLNSMKSGYSNPVQRFDAARLSHRVRLGCVEDSVPLLFRSQDQVALLTRKEARQVFDAGVRSSDIALGAADFSGSLPVDRQLAVRDRVREFVNYQLSELASSFTSGLGASANEAVSGKYWDYAQRRIAELTSGATTDKSKIVWDPSSVAALLTDLNYEKAVDTGYVIQLVPGEDHLALNILSERLREEGSKSGAMSRVASLVACFSDEVSGDWPADSTVLIVDFPWLVGGKKSDPGKEIRVSPASYGVLLGFLTRNLFVDPATAIEAIRSAATTEVLAARPLMKEIFPYLKTDTPASLIDSWVRYMELGDIPKLDRD